MNSLLTLEELISTVLRKMYEIDYSKETILNYKRFYRRFLEYAKSRELLYFSEDLGSQYVKIKYGCTHRAYLKVEIPEQPEWIDDKSLMEWLKNLCK